MAVKGKGKQVASSSSSSAKRKTSFGDEAEGSSVAAARASQRRRPGVLQFVDDAALEADFDDPETDDQEADNDFLDDSKAQNDLKGIGKPHQLPFVLKEEELSADELEELIKDRYRQGSKLVVYDEDSKEHDVGISAVDSTTDPTIWRVKCMVGRERQMAFCFMQKYVDLSNLGTKMQIISAFALDHVKGYVFVEAEKACDISEACKGFCNIYASRVSLVARSEVPHLLSTRNKPCEASEGSWVRLKSGKYKGDLAQVVSVDDGRKTVMIKLVPRVDLQAISKKLGGGISLKHAPVPAPRLINSHELEEFRPHIEIKRDRQTGDLFEVLDGLMVKDGYLYKKVSIGSLIYWGVKPSDAELLKFSKTNKDEDEDLNWVSTIYVDRKRKHIAEELDQKAANIKEDVFNLHDLVLFGRKDFGVIIAIEKDGLRLLKGDTEGYEVAMIRKEDIKGGCVDKMFTALDCHMKTISINDIVRVTEGPMQGKQGTVRHMYKGSLFILDESETKHSAFFCARSNSCENIKEIKESIGSFGEDLGETSAPSFPRPPIKSYEQDYSSRESGKRRQSDREQMFSIGQTLRISKGPLKGYLCRVVRIYRSDVTVKLDSLVKIITVDAKFLSVPTRKRDDSAAAASDLFGASEMPSIVSLSVGGNGPQVDRSSWDIELPSFGSDTWQPFSSSTSARDNDHKADKELESDPWGSKVTSGVGSDACHSDKPLDSWGKAAGSSGGQSSAWHKTTVDDKTIGAIGGQVENSQKDPDNWSNKALNNASCGTSAWEKATLLKNAAAGSWGTESSRGGVDGHKKEESSWNQASARKGSSKIDGWEKEKQPNSDSGGMGVKERTKTGKQPDDSGDVMGNLERLSSADPTNRSADDVSGWEKGTSTKEGQVNAAQEVAGSNNRNAWDSKGKMINEDGWGKASHLPEKITAGPDSGNTNSSSHWNTATSRQLSSAKQQGDQAGWNNWEKPINKGIAESSGWNNAGTSSWSKPTSSGGDHESSWSKPRNFEGGRGFGRGRGRSFGESGNRNQDSNWKKPADRDAYHGSNWGKGMDINSYSAGSTGRESNWNKQRDFDGDRGTSWGRGRGRFSARGGNGWKPQGDEEDSKVSGRGGRNGAGNNWKDNDGTRPSGHGRGDGWSQSSGWSHSSDRNNDPANSGGQIVPRNEGSSWGNDQNTGRGGGRNGAGNNWKENDGTRPPSSHGGGSGWSQSSNRANEQANSGGQTVPRNEGSRWGKNQNSGRDGGCNGSGNSWKESDGTKTAGGSSSWSKSSDWGNHRESRPGDQTIPRNEGSSWGNDQSKPRNEGPSLGNNDQNTGWEKTAGKWGETKGSTGDKGGW